MNTIHKIMAVVSWLALFYFVSESFAITIIL
jgi:hypothetical protein